MKLKKFTVYFYENKTFMLKETIIIEADGIMAALVVASNEKNKRTDVYVGKVEEIT